MHVLRRAWVAYESAGSAWRSAGSCQDIGPGYSLDRAISIGWMETSSKCPVSHGPRIGTFAEYIAIDQDDVACKPASLTLHEAAAAPLVSLAAWQALVDRAHVRPGQKVPVHAGSGGLGSTVIQRWPA
jgi:NADPH:quinone reductase-like Zn-dependent oxidoreductase